MNESTQSPLVTEEAVVSAEPILATEEEAAIVAPETEAAEAPKKVKKIKKRRPLALRIILSIVAVFLCMALFFVTVAGALLLDLRVLTSEEGMTKVVTALVSASASAPEHNRLFTIVSTSRVHLASEEMVEEESAGILTDLVYDMLQKHFGSEEVPLSKDAVREFVEESTVTEFFTDKLVGVAQDFLDDTSETVITKEEVVELVRENTALIEEKLELEISEEHIEKFETALEEVKPLEKIEDKGLLNYLVDMYAGVEEPESGEAGNEGETGDGETVTPGVVAPDGGGKELLDTLARIKQIGAYIRTATSNQTLSYVGGILLLLMLLVWLCNGTLPKTLSDLGITFLVAGLLLSAANLAVDSGLLGGILPIPAGVWGVIRGVLSAIAAVHYTIMIAGGSLIVLAIAAKIIKTSIQKKKAAAAA